MAEMKDREDSWHGAHNEEGHRNAPAHPQEISADKVADERDERGGKSRLGGLLGPIGSTERSAVQCGEEGRRYEHG